jgi:uncharacterized membrane protein
MPLAPVRVFVGEWPRQFFTAIRVFDPSRYTGRLLRVPRLAQPRAAGSAFPDPLVGRSSRVVFIDLARAFAVLFMIQGHTLGVLLAPAYQSGAAFDFWLFLRGLTSCTFLLLSGCAFAVATSRHWDAHIAWSRRLVRRLARFGFFVLLGYAMHLPASRFGDLKFVTAEGWRAFEAVDVLQCVGISLMGLQLLVVATKTRRRFMFAAAALSAVTVAVTPLASGIDWTRVVARPVAAYVSGAGGSLFPLLPWAGFLLLGAFVGMSYEMWASGRPARFANRALLPAGLGLLLAGLGAHFTAVALYGDRPLTQTSPVFFVIRAGCVLLLLGGFARLSERIRSLPPALTALSQESLLVYFVHVVVLYGSVWNVGLRQLIGARLGPGPTTMWIAVLLVSMGLLASAWSWFKRTRQDVAPLLRFAVGSVALLLLV